MKRPSLSVVYAVYNEEKNLPRTLDSIKSIADEIVIADGGSTDQTVQIARKYGARVIQTDNPPMFHINKQKALDAANGDWILQMDADEVLTPELAEEIHTRITDAKGNHHLPFTIPASSNLAGRQAAGRHHLPSIINGYSIPRRNYFWGHFMKKSGVYPDRVIRLVRRGKAHLPCQSVHEQIHVDGDIGEIDEPMLHYSYQTRGDYWKKAHTYTALTADEIDQQSKNGHNNSIMRQIRTYMAYVIIRPIITFILLYVRHKGFLDGLQGFEFCLYSALHYPIAYYLYENRETKRYKNPLSLSIGQAVPLLGIVLIAVFLRWHMLPTHLFFGPEQGRDLLVVQKIVEQHTPTLIGGKTDIDGLFYGPLGYYIMSIFSFLFHGNPLGVTFGIIVFQAVAVVCMFFIGREVSGTKLGLLASYLFAISYHAVEYGRWLSSLPLTIPFMMLFVLAALYTVQYSGVWLIAAGLAAGCVIQMNFGMLVNLIPLFGLLILYRIIKHHDWKHAVLASIVFAGTAFGTFVLFDLRHEFLITNALFHALVGNGGFRVGIVTAFIDTLRMYGTVIETAIGIPIFLPESVRMGIASIMLGVGSTLSFRWKKPVIALWILWPVFAIIVSRHAVLIQMFSFSLGAILLTISLAICWLDKRTIIGAMLLILCLTVGNAYTYMDRIPYGRVFFQGGSTFMRYTDQLHAIDTVYEWAGASPFSMQSYTIPWFWQDGWTYLFSWYGRQKYGKVPVAEKAPYPYVIIQKDRTDPKFQQDWYMKTVQTWGTLRRSTVFGDVTVEERQVPKEQL